MHIIATERCMVDLDALSPELVAAIGQHCGIETDIITTLRDRMLTSTYAQLNPLFAKMKAIAIQHGQGDLVQVI